MVVMTLLTALALPAAGATVTGTLVDIGLQPFNTKIVFTPTNEVQVSSAGLSAGPPKILDTANGAFSILLDTGDYVVALPLVPSRRPFMISVLDTNGTVNITNLISTLPLASTNNPNYTVKATVTDTGPGILNAKIHVAGSLTKILSTNSGAVSITLSNSPVASALDNDNIHIGADGFCTFGIQGVPFNINAGGNFDRLSIGDSNQHSLNNDGSFSLANTLVTGDTAGNLTAASFTTTGEVEITDTAKGVILKSPGGTRYRLKVADDGTLSTEVVP
jgi:hypothetical protein